MMDSGSESSKQGGGKCKGDGKGKAPRVSEVERVFNDHLFTLLILQVRKLAYGIFNHKENTYRKVSRIVRVVIEYHTYQILIKEVLLF